MTEPVRIERQGPVATVILERPAGAQRRRSGDRGTRWPRRSSSSSATTRCASSVLWGAGGTFCAGADLKAVAARLGSRALREPTGEAQRRLRADGPDAPAARQARDRRDRRSRGGGRPRTRAVVRPARDGGRRRARRVLPPLGRAADRRRHGAPAAADRPRPRARPDPHRTPGRRRRGAGHRARRTASCPRARRAAAAEALAEEIAAFPQGCLRADRALGLRAVEPRGGRGAAGANSPAGAPCSESGESARARRASSAAPAAAGFPPEAQPQCRGPCR